MDESFVKIVPATQWMLDNIVEPSLQKDNTGRWQSTSCWDLTHVVFKDKKHIGQLSIGAIPLVTCFLNKEAHARDTHVVAQFIENHVISVLGHHNMVVLGEPSCPIAPYLERVGYEKTIYNQVFLKDLKFKP